MEKFREKYPRLKKGEQKIFELINLREDPYNKGRLAIPFSKGVPTKDRIWDQYDKEYKDIAYIKSVGINNEITVGDIHFYLRTQGRIICRGGVAAEEDMYDYLLLSNYREDNKARDTTVVPIYRFVNPKAIADGKREARKHLFLAIDKYRELDDDRVKKLIVSMGEDESQDIGILRDILEDMAQNKPEDFMALYTDPMGERKAILQRAVDKGVIEWHPNDSKFTWGGSDKTIAVIARGSDKDNIEEMAVWTMKSEKEEAVYQEIAKRVTSKKESKKAVATA